MKASNILKVVDIESTELTADFIEYINKQDPTYRDQALKENIFNHENIIEAQEESGELMPIPIAYQLDEIAKLIRKHHAGYFRIIY